MPEISILMSVYNGQEYIKESIDSILNQTYEDFELIIVNDSSTDETQNIIESYPDPRIKLYNFTQNRGVGAALKFALSEAQGKYIAKLDADDISIADRLMKQKTFLDNNPDIMLVRGFIEYFPHNERVLQSERYRYFKSVMENEQNSVVSSDEIRQKLYWYNCIPHTTIMARSDSLKKIGYKELRIGEDYKLFYELNKNGYKMATIKEVLVKMRVSESSITAVNLDSYFPVVFEEIKKEEISNLFEQNSKVYIWGAGSFGQRVFNILNKNSLVAEGFIDSDKTKQRELIMNKQVHSPEFLKEKRENVKIIIASGGKFEIAKDLINLGYEDLKDFMVYC